MLSSNQELTPDFERLPDELKKEFNQVKKKLDKFSKNLIDKHDILGISFFFDKKATKVVIVTEENIKPSKKGFDIQVINLETLWKGCLENSEVVDLISRSTSIYDKGVLRAAKLTYLHKNMVISKLGKYIVSYVLDGSVIKGKAKETSDIDVWIVIDDTDVKKMSKSDLQSRLRAMILSMAMDVEAITATKNRLHVQTWLLTDFWEGLKDASPVFVTSLMQSVPLHDRGLFDIWKNMLNKSYITPPHEAIDKQMEAGELILRKSLDKKKEAALDLYFSAVSISQAALMKLGYTSRPEHIVDDVEKLLIKKEKNLNDKHVKLLKKLTKIKENIEDSAPSCGELDKLSKDVEELVDKIKKVLGIKKKIK